jgi:phenylpropionate dioxygenase-like ring-hydroxylating dioxygenase large terminal subunit
MLSVKDNELLTRVGPGTPMGEVFRRYWLPAVLSEELPESDGAPVRVRLLGEDLVAFRDSAGKVGLVSAFCPHRRAPLFFGRNEEGGIRCVYHGWKFDRNGHCVDMPSEPPDSLFKTKVAVEAYPTHEAGDMIWAYLGPPGAKPPLPDYELLRAPAASRHASKTYQECNYLQALEGGLDSAHFTILHNENIGDGSFLEHASSPDLDIEPTAYGYRYSALRFSGSEQWVRAYQFLMPAQQMRAARVPSIVPEGEPTRVEGHIWVPIDDTTTWSYNWFYAYETDGTFTPEQRDERERRAGRGPEDLLPGYRSKRNLSNDYMIDRERQRTTSFTGISGVNTQDMAVQEGMGPVVDRTREHLGTTDRPVIIMRQMLLEATRDVAAGTAPRGSQPESYRDVRPLDHMIPRELDWKVALRNELIAKF